MNNANNLSFFYKIIKGHLLRMQSEIYLIFKFHASMQILEFRWKEYRIEKNI